LVVLTGAGISAESGIRTFRDAGGLWEGYRPEEVAHLAAFARDPSLVHRFYNQRRRQLQEPGIRPNPAHLALAQLEREWQGDFLLVTQNVDNLHERAGSKKLLHMHGELNRALCSACRRSGEWLADMDSGSSCQFCGKTGSLRPDIVWFSEIPYFLEKIFPAVKSCQLFLSIGTSGNVYPAAGFARQAALARRIEVNVANSEISGAFQEHRLGPAGIEVPKLVQVLLGG
jgi:NAD-dependent deacetylase